MSIAWSSERGLEQMTNARKVLAVANNRSHGAYHILVATQISPEF